MNSQKGSLSKQLFGISVSTWVLVCSIRICISSFSFIVSFLLTSFMSMLIEKYWSLIPQHCYIEVLSFAFNLILAGTPASWNKPAKTNQTLGGTTSWSEQSGDESLEIECGPCAQSASVIDWFIRKLFFVSVIFKISSVSCLATP